MSEWYLVRNDRQKPDRGSDLIRTYYSMYGIPRPFRDEQATRLGTVEPISEDLAQVLLGLIQQEGFAQQRVIEWRMNHADQTGKEARRASQRQGDAR